MGHIKKNRRSSDILRRYGYLVVGTFLMAVAYKSIYDSVGMVTGGFSGIGVIVKRISTRLWEGGIPLWLTNTCLNIPLFLCAFIIEGKRFVKDTLLGTVLLTVYLAILPSVPVPEADYLLASVYGGVICGVGVGLILKSGFTTGGTDMLAVLLHRIIKYYSLAKIIQILDGLIIAAGMIILGLDVSLYAIIAIYVSALVTDSVLEGAKHARAAIIISEKNDEIAPLLIEKVKRGVTRFPARGVFSQKERNVLLCIVSKKQIPEVKEIVLEIDEKSFLIVGDVREVMGEGFVQKLQ